MLATNIRVVTIAGAVAILVLVVELVRRRKLKEEYSVLWVATALILLVLSIWYGGLVAITKAVGAVLPSSTLFFFGLLFAFVMLLHFSVRISAMERRITSLVQELGLLSLEQRQLIDAQRAGEETLQRANGAASVGSPADNEPRRQEEPFR